MTMDFVKKLVVGAIAIMLFSFAPLNSAQDKPADNMQILREKLKADKETSRGDQYGTDGVGRLKVFGRSTSSIKRTYKRSTNALPRYWRIMGTTSVRSR